MSPPTMTGQTAKRVAKRVTKSVALKWALGVGLGVVVPGLGLLFVFMSLVALIGGSSSANEQAGCEAAPTSQPATYHGKPVGSLTQLQMTRAAAVVAQGRKMGIPDRGIVVALATASQESGFKVYANDGVIQYSTRWDARLQRNVRVPDLAPEQRKVGESMKMPHDAVGTDHGSLGVFQQQFPWWGTMAELMDPATSAKKFYEALLKVKGWQQMPVTVAAQTVQRSAYPDAYADDQALAEQLLVKISGSGSDNGAADGAAEAEPAVDVNAAGDVATMENGVYVGGTADCLTTAATVVASTGAIVFPLPANSGYVNQHNFGNRGSHWASTHTGNDYSVACGTKVFAVHDGIVEFDSSQASWAGSHFVRIGTGQGKLATWYAHMSSRTVKEGQKVRAGQQIGTVGTEGNSGGCHLHLEVHPTGGRIYEDPVDPVTWLAKHMRRGTRSIHNESTRKPRKLPARPPSDAFRIGTFNALGHSHTNGPRANHRSMPSSYGRTRRMVPFLERHHLDLIGFQEFQPPQAKLFRQISGKTWGMRGNKDNAVAWRKDTFKFVSSRTVAIPYFHGHPRHMPVVRLRVRGTNKVFTVISIHNPANVAGPAAGYRAQAERNERRVVRREVAAGRPVLLVGDFNAYKPTYCRVTAGGLMTASAGGSPRQGGARCKAPKAFSIDWIFGSRGIAFGGHLDDATSKRRRISDHHLFAADFQFGTAAPATGQPATPKELTVLTLDAANGKPGARKLRSQIDNSGADVVALQNVDTGGQLGQLARQLGDDLGMQYAFTAVGRRNGREVADNAILSRYPIVEADHTTLPTQGGQPRGMLRVTVAAGKTRVDIYATHLDETGKVRVQQARVVADEIGRTSCPTVVMGKFNLNLIRLARQGLLADLADTLPRSEDGRSPRRSYVFHDVETRTVQARLLARVSGNRPLRAVLRPEKEETC